MDKAQPDSVSSLKILNGALVFFGGRARIECAEVLAPAGTGINFPGV